MDENRNNISRRNFLKTLGIVAGSTVVLSTGGKLLYDILSDDNKLDTFFDEKYYLDISGKIEVPYMDHHVLFEEMPTVYDNILYAKEINGKKNVKDTVIYKTCTRIQPLEETINAYAEKYNIPVNKLLGLIFLESEGKANTGNKGLGYRYNCYGYTQISVLVGKEYGAIKRDSKGKWIDRRDNLETALDTTCRFLTEIHNKRIKNGHNDNNRSLTFASYHMGETHMNKILKVAQNKANMKADNMQDLIGLNNKEVASEFIELQDESYKYYPKLLAAGRIYDLFKGNRKQFNHNLEEFLNSPIRRKPSLAEEYIWHGNGTYYDKNMDLKHGMEERKLFGVKSKKENLEIDDNIGEKMFLSEKEESLGHQEQSQLKKERQEGMRMSSKATRGLVKFISHYFPYDFKVTSLTRSQEYNDKIYNSQGKWTSHATGMAMDIGFPGGLEKKKIFKTDIIWSGSTGENSFFTRKKSFSYNNKS